MSGLGISPTEKTQELLGAAKDLALENSNTQVIYVRCCPCVLSCLWVCGGGGGLVGRGVDGGKGWASLFSPIHQPLPGRSTRAGRRDPHHPHKHIHTFPNTNNDR